MRDDIHGYLRAIFRALRTAWIGRVSVAAFMGNRSELSLKKVRRHRCQNVSR